jgi:hypothetical protein
MNSFMISGSLGLQYGVPLEVYGSKFSHMRFEPSGMTNEGNDLLCIGAGAERSWPQRRKTANRVRTVSTDEARPSSRGSNTGAFPPSCRHMNAVS